MQVHSANIKSIEWEEGILTVTFATDRTYEYRNVDYDLFHRIVTAKSVGAEFNRTVRCNKYAYPYRETTGTIEIRATLDYDYEKSQFHVSEFDTGNRVYDSNASVPASDPYASIGKGNPRRNQ